MNNQRRNKNGGVAPNKLIMSEQFKINMQECFSKNQRKINLENQSVDIRKRKDQVTATGFEPTTT